MLPAPITCFNTCCKTFIISNTLKMLNNQIQCFCLIQGAPGTPGDDILQRASEEALPL